MDKIIDAENILCDARDCVWCVGKAAAQLEDEETETDPIQTVTDIAIRKIEKAISLLHECRTDMNTPIGDQADAPDVTPKSPAAQTKRKGK